MTIDVSVIKKKQSSQIGFKGLNNWLNCLRILSSHFPMATHLVFLVFFPDIFKNGNFKIQVREINCYHKVEEMMWLSGWLMFL